MSITFISAKKALNSAFFKLPVLESEIQKLSKNLEIYINSAKDGESEEYHKGLIKDFFANTWYSPSYSVNTNGREDLVIFNGNDTASKPAVIIEAKSPTNMAEMFSKNNQNCKALQECVYYFLQENLKFGNNEIKHIIITNYEDFYIFDAKNFSRFFLAKTNPIIDQFNKFEAKQLVDTKTSFFYENCAKPAIEKWIECENINVTHVNPKDFYGKGAESLIPLYKIFSPEHLLAKPFANDSNSLDRNFYAELLHIIGLEEIKDGGKKLIQRKSADSRDSASLIESAIYQLEEEISNEEKCFEIALHLVITWVNRLLFLKLVESQQVAYQKGNIDYKFLTEKLVPDFDELNILFFKVLGRKIENRDSEVHEKYKFVPYLNSSLFEISEEESRLQIRGIKNKPIKIYSKTVLKDEKGNRLTGTLDNLAYIFRFLDAYNFSSDSAGGITQNSKTLINASVLGLIFEKINGYKDGSFFTPGFITEYMAKETVERAVIQKFNDAKGWKCKNLDELADEIDDRAEANEIFNTIRICDPAVGSGHFLVSILNRLLFIKSYLDILLDKNGKRIKRGDWELRLENDEISILDEDGNPFVYTTNSERQRVQETIFAEKRTIIENCLFGVDINPELNGIEVLRKIRKESDVPVILETARDETFDKINGLNTGADDYISKPFDIEELIARIHSVLRRCEKTKNSSHILKAGNIEINPEKMQVSVSGSSLNFSKTEFFLLKFLIENKGKVLDRNTIIDSVWGKEHFIDAGAVDVYIRFLRTKIKEFDDTEYIKTVRGSGYIFEE